eukprot:5239921-Amphidinium_carterae.1
MASLDQETRALIDRLATLGAFVLNPLYNGLQGTAPHEVNKDPHAWRHVSQYHMVGDGVARERI